MAGCKVIIKVVIFYSNFQDSTGKVWRHRQLGTDIPVLKDDMNETGDTFSGLLGLNYSI